MNTTAPKISIILPTYNRERFLQSAIEAILAQTETDWELIVVNDCSPDNTKAVVEGYMKKDARIRLINNEVNKKLPASLNVGFDAARGKYYTWTSDDNVYHPTALEKMSAYLDAHSETDMIVMNAAMLDENDKQVYNVYDFVSSYDYQRCTPYLASYNNVLAAFMYTKEIANKVGLYDVNTYCAEDYDYWLRIALAGRIDYTDDIVYTYRFHPTTLTSTEEEKIKLLAAELVQKYADDMLDKYYPTWSDKYNYAINHKTIRLNKHPFISISAKIGSLITPIIVAMIFWNAKLRRNVRHTIQQRRNVYSFTIKRNK